MGDKGTGVANDVSVAVDRDTIEVTSVIYHSDLSKAEGYPGIVRVIAPRYMSFVVGADTFSTNYTATLNASDESLTNLTVVDLTPSASDAPDTPDEHTFDFVFRGGVTYGDVIELNFTMTVDPAAMRAVGSGVEDSALVLSPICVRNVFVLYPPDDPGSPYEHQTQCGSHSVVPFASVSPECFDPIPLEVDECVWASSQFSSDYPPHHSLSADDSQGGISQGRTRLCMENPFFFFFNIL